METDFSLASVADPTVQSLILNALTKLEEVKAIATINSIGTNIFMKAISSTLFNSTSFILNLEWAS